MTRKKVLVIFAVIFALLLVSTVAYAYVGPQLGSRSLTYGMIGGDVQQLQTMLTREGYSLGAADGIFGAKTKNAVVSFQAANRLAVDGIVGPATLKALSSVLPAGSRNGSFGSGSGGSTNQALAAILKAKGISAPIPNRKIVISKTNHQLTLYSGTTPLKTYAVDIGDGGLGDKQRAGDHKTPEGTFTIAEKSVLTPEDQYLGTRWMRLGYPNIADAQRGLRSGLITQAVYNSIVSAINKGQTPPQYTALGGGVGIHGGDDRNGPGDWTWGCIGLSNANVNELFNYVAVGDQVVILH